MSRSIDDLQTRLNLCSDSYYENFCDVLTDTAVKVGTTASIEPGNLIGLNDCRRQSHSSVDVTRNQEFLLKLIKPWDWDLSSLKLVHRFLLHMQAEEIYKLIYYGRLIHQMIKTHLLTITELQYFLKTVEKWQLMGNQI